MKKRCAIYLRSPNSGSSTDVQFKECQIYAATHELYVTKIYEDSGVTGVATRKGFQRLLRDAREDKFDYVLTESLLRPFASMRHLCTTIQEWMELEIGFIAVNDGIDSKSMQGRHLMHLLTVLARFEGSVMGERTQAGINGSKNKGQFGYHRKVNREEVIRLLNAGSKQINIAKAMKCSPVTVHKIVSAYKEQLRRERVRKRIDEQQS